MAGFGATGQFAIGQAGVPIVVDGIAVVFGEAAAVVTVGATVITAADGITVTLADLVPLIALAQADTLEGGLDELLVLFTPAPSDRTIIVAADHDRATPALSVDREPRRTTIQFEPRLIKPH